MSQQREFASLAAPVSNEQAASGNVGMTLLDYFAAMTLQRVVGVKVAIGAPGWQEEAAWNAYSIARAMIAERSKTS